MSGAVAHSGSQYLRNVRRTFFVGQKTNILIGGKIKHHTQPIPLSCVQQ